MRALPLRTLAAGAAALALTLTLQARPQEDPPPVDGPYLIPAVQVWSGPGEAPTTRGLLVHDAAHVQWFDGTVDPALFPEATVVEADEDWILYPSLFHAAMPASLRAMEGNPYLGTASDPRQGPMPAMEYGTRNSFHGHVRIADHLEWDGEGGGDWRALGFGGAMVLPQRGLVQGHASAVALNGRPLGEALLTREGPQVLSLSSSGGYPQTAMAALAMHRQLLLDQDRPGLAPDLTLAASRVFRANSPRAIENILDLQRDFRDGDASWTILGGRGARHHVERLLAQDVGVLYLLDLDEEEESEEELDLDDGAGRPWWQEPARLREERRRLQAEEVAEFLALREAGVRCALVPAAKSGELMEQVARLVEAGLDPEQALLALSRDARALVGVEAGASDFLLSDGPLSFEEPRLAGVGSHGRLFPFALGEDGDEEEGEAEDAEEGALDGHWSMLVETPMGDQEFGILVDAAAPSVEIYGLEDPEEREAATAVGVKDGRQLKFDFQVPDPEMEVTVFLRLEEDGLDGKMSTPFGDVPMFGERFPEGQEPEGGVASGGPAAAEEEDEQEADEEDAEDGVAPLGHPAWPVEIVADRVPPSDWARERGGSVLLRGGTLWRVDGSEPEVGDLLIVDGIIRGVGGTQAPPPGTPVVDMEGMHLMPGIIDAHSHLALDAINEGSVSISAAVRVGDMIHPHEVGIWRAAAGGTTVVQALHGSANPIGGQSATWTLDYHAQRIADLLVEDAPRNIKFALGENVKQSNWESARGKRFPNSRIGVDAVFRRAFIAAQDYAEARRLAADGTRPGFRRDVRLEVLADILDNTVHVQCHSYRADELQMFLAVCAEFGIEGPTFQHVLEGYKVAPEIAAAGAMASSFSDWWAYKYEVRDAIPWNVEILHKAGVVVSINSDSDEMIRRLNTEAAKAQRYGGLSWEDAMVTCTLAAAKQLRLDDRLGSLEVGKEGTVTVFDGPPLSTHARCMLTLARGVALFEYDPAAEARWTDYAAAAADFAAAHRAEAEPAAAPAAPTAEELEPWTRPGRGEAWWITGATVHTPGEEPFTGTLHVKDGMIHQLYRGRVDAPQNLRVETVDARGMNLYPGFIDGLDRTGLFEIGAVHASRDDIETGIDHPDLSTKVAIHADSAHHRVTRLNGIAYVLARPDSGRIRGRGALIQLAGTTSEDMIAQADLGMFIQFPRVPRRIDIEDGPKEAEGLDELDRWFDRAEEYRDSLARYEAAGRAPLARDLRLEALLPCLDGSQPVFLEAEDAPTLMAARAWAAERGLRAVYVGARDAWKVAGYFGADGADLVLGSVHRLPRSDFDPHDSVYRNASVLRAAGARVALSTDDPEVTRNLPYQAATAGAWGLGKDGALASITIDAARILGVDRFVGSIEEGKVASFFLIDGDPFDLEVGPARMWIGGGEVELTSHQTELRDRYLERLPGAGR